MPDRLLLDDVTGDFLLLDDATGDVLLLDDHSLPNLEGVQGFVPFRRNLRFDAGDSLRAFLGERNQTWDTADRLLEFTPEPDADFQR